MKRLLSLSVLLLVICSTNSQSTSCTGRCVPLSDCPSLQRLFDSIHTNPSALSILRGKICQVFTNIAHVCCIDDVQPRAPTGLLPSTCGVIAFSDRIIDGKPAPLLAWPWMVLLRGRSPEGRTRFFCGGVLISDRYVLTAAHCVSNSALYTIGSVRIGEHTISSDPDCVMGVCAPSPQDIGIEEVIVHEEYQRPCLRCNDIALLRLATRPRIDNLHVSPICLPINPERSLGFSAQELKSERAWIAGWGATEGSPSRSVNQSSSDVLLQANIPIDDRFCQLDLDGYPDHNMVLCAGGEGKDSCNGDSGGPLVVSNSRKTRRYLVGIVSKGPVVCGARDTAGVYTNVIFYTNWILEHLRP